MSKAIVLMYHNIAIPPQGARIPNLYVTPRMFLFQMWYLRTAGFKVMSIQNLLAAVAAGDTAGNMAAITFDDGYQDFYTNAYPVLKRYGYPSTVYVVSGMVEKGNVWDAMNETAEKPLMGWDSIIEVSRNNVQIGSHTRTHPQLTTLSDEALRDELVGSKQELESRLGRSVEHFCYPYGDQNDAVKEAVKGAGYLSAVTTQRGHVVKGFDPVAVRRVPVKLITNPVSFLYKVHTDSEKRKGRQQ